MMNGSCSVTDCYATGAVTASTGYVGGLVGVSYASAVTRSYSTGSITCTGTNQGGLVGFNNTGSVINSYWNTETSGMATSSGGTGISSVQMRTMSTFSGWDFAGESTNGTADLWTLSNTVNNGFPYLTAHDMNVGMQVSATNLTFGTIYMGQINCDQPIVIANTSRVNDLYITAATMTNGNTGFTPILPTLPLRVPAGTSCNVTVHFDPAIVGACSDVLHITTNASANPAIDITLSGTGVYIAPSAPQNLQPVASGNNMVLTWSPVTQTTTGLPMAVTGYAVLYSETPDANTDDYLFHGFTTNTTYTHAGVLHFSNHMYYRVVAAMWPGNARRNAVDLQNLPSGTLTWGQIKAMMKRP
jgi:hypothetical protein